MQIIGGILIAVLLGNFLDDAIRTRPLFLILLILYVIVGSLYQLVKKAKDTDE